MHGEQYNQQPWSAIPTTYYTRSGPIGDVMSLLESRAKPESAALIGLGAGTLAAYGRENLALTYYEIDPAIIRIASDKSLFTYISDSKSRINFVQGDARITLAHAPDGAYDLIAVDAFSSDAIPVHLITSQAVELYFKKLAPNGIAAFHISNWFLDLKPVLGNIACDLGLDVIVRRDEDLSKEDIRLGKYVSIWVLMARNKDAFAGLANNALWQPISPRHDLRTWTDDYSDILSVMRWSRKKQ